MVQFDRWYLLLTSLGHSSERERYVWQSWYLDMQSWYLDMQSGAFAETPVEKEPLSWYSRWFEVLRQKIPLERKPEQEMSPPFLHDIDSGRASKAEEETL